MGERHTVQTALALAHVEGFIRGREGERGERKEHRVALWEERERKKRKKRKKTRGISPFKGRGAAHVHRDHAAGAGHACRSKALCQVSKG